MGNDTMMDRVNNIIRNERYQFCLQTINRYEQDRIFCKHDMEHFLSVARIMRIKALQENILIDQEIIYATALLHDIGRVVQYEKGHAHAHAGEQIAKVILQESGFRKDEEQAITTAILTHNDPKGEDPLSELLRFADKISRTCFLCPANKECNWPEEKRNKGVAL